MMGKVVVMVVVVVMMVGVVSAYKFSQAEDKDIPSQPEDDTAASDTWIARLYKDQLLNYTKRVRPVINPKHPTTVTMGLSLKNIHLDDENQEFTLNAWTVMTWRDELLHWSPVDYMNIKRLHFDEDDIWLPDMTVYNSAKGSEAHPFGTVPVLVEASGQAFWFPPTHIAVSCDLDLTTWPRDEHVCVVRMGSWSHHGQQIDIQVLSQNGSTGVMIDTLEKNSRWELVHADGTRSRTNMDGHDPYIEINFNFRVRRQARTQATYITQSTLAVVVVVVASYLLPLHKFLSRLLMHLFALGVEIVCFFTLFALLPANGGPVPIVVRYYSGSIILTTLSLLATLGLTTQACCCCCSCSSSQSSLSKTLTTIVTSPFRRGEQETDSSHGSTYRHLENEVTLEEDEEDRRPRASQLNQVAGSSHYVNLREAAAERGGEGGGGGGERVTHSQFLQVINFLLMTMFTVAFVVDYVVLRNVTL